MPDLALTMTLAQRARLLTLRQMQAAYGGTLPAAAAAELASLEALADTAAQMQASPHRPPFGRQEIR